MSLTRTGADANEPPLQQNWMMGDKQPLGVGAIGLTTQIDRKFEIPLPATPIR